MPPPRTRSLPLQFDKEWKKFTKLQALQKVGHSNIIALKSANIEDFIPKENIHETSDSLQSV
jgi:hypothetical protein